jgi:hypothetical protein
MKKDIENLNKFTSNFIVSSRGQLDYPGMNTLIPNANGRITMKGVKQNVLGIDDLGNKKIMKPKKEYQFPGDSVYEIPLNKRGGQFKKGLVSNPKKTKKSSASKKYSRSLSATNVLFTENSLFKKPKSRKNKVFDPNSKYYAEGGESKCQPDEYWNGKKCVKLPKNAFVTSDPKKYAFRKAAYDDSLTGYNNMNYVNSFFTGKRKNGVPIYNWKGFDKNKIKSSSVKPTSYKDFYREGHEHEGTGQLAKFKKPVQPVVFQEVYKSVVPTTRTVYIECPPGSVSNDEKTEVITNDPDSPGNYLRTITTGCKPEKIENLPLLKPGLIDSTKDELQGNTLNEEELELPNEEVESEYLEEGSPDTENAMEWVNKRKYNIDWDGIQIPYRLPRFRKPGSYGDLIKPGKKRYINLPKITSRNTAYLREKQDGGELCPKGMVWSKKDKKCIDLPVFNSGLNNGTLEKFTNLSDGLIIKPLNSFSDFGKIKPKKIPVVEDSFLETLEKDINDFLDNPLKKAAQVSESLKEKGEDPSDALRHSIAGALAAQTIANKTGNIPFISNPLGYLGANIAGIGHELSTLSQTYLDDRPWKIKLQESLEDIYNNSVGANTIFNNNSEKDKINYLLKLTRTNQLPDGYGEERPFRDNPKWTDPYNQKQYGGINKFDGGGEKNKCKDGEYWDGTKCTKLISYANDKKFIDGVGNWAMQSSNPDKISSEYNDQIKHYLYSGNYGYDPVSGTLYPLKKEQRTVADAETKKILAKQDDKAAYTQSIIDAGFDPETFGKSKGTNVITGEEIYGDKSQEDVDKINKEAINNFVTEGHKKAILESPFNTAAFFTPAGMAAGAMQGAAHLLPDIYDFGKDPSWSGAGAIAMDALMMSPTFKNLGKFLKVPKQQPIYRGVYINDEIRNLPKFKGRTDDEILDIMGTTIPGNTGTRRKSQLNQTLNFGRDYNSALEHIGKFTDEGAISRLGNTKDLTSGQMYILKVQPDDLPFISAEQQSKLYKQHIDAWKKNNPDLFILGTDAKNINPELLKEFGESAAFRTEGTNVFSGNFPQYVGAENTKIGKLLESKKVSRQDYLDYLEKLKINSKPINKNIFKLVNNGMPIEVPKQLPGSPNKNMLYFRRIMELKTF